jgi:hypothetical protein
MRRPGDHWTAENEATLRKLTAAVEVSFAAGDYAVVMNMARMENVEQIPKSIWRRLASEAHKAGWQVVIRRDEFVVRRV